jgi:hypothetical protein
VKSTTLWKRLADQATGFPAFSCASSAMNFGNEERVNREAPSFRALYETGLGFQGHSDFLYYISNFVGSRKFRNGFSAFLSLECALHVIAVNKGIAQTCNLVPRRCQPFLKLRLHGPKKHGHGRENRWIFR